MVIDIKENSILKYLVKRLPPIARLIAQRDALAAQVAALQNQDKATGVNFPPGHFYSPIPDLDQIAADADRIFAPPPREIAGVDLREATQLELFEALASYYDELPFPVQETKGFRYYYENPFYSYSDGITLYAMIRHFKPRRIVEIGSGHSSGLMLDCNERFFENAIKLTFVDPYPANLRKILRSSDESRVTVLEQRAQDLSLSLFAPLQANDVLFVDSTHVSKIDSDVNRLLFEILPALNPGVLIHIHDIFYPFEYPRAWIEEGRAWSELYLLRAFLQYNPAFEILYFNTYLEHFHEALFAEKMPLCLKNKGGSIWLRHVCN